jgi:hypothetical protein
LFGMYLKWSVEVSNVALQASSKAVSTQTMHGRLGHIHEDACRHIAGKLGVVMQKGAMPVCIACTTAKARQKNLSKHEKTICAKVPKGQLFMDILTIQVPDDVMVTIGKPVWHIAVDDLMGMKFTHYYATKSNGGTDMCMVEEIGAKQQCSSNHPNGQCWREQKFRKAKQQGRGGILNHCRTCASNGALCQLTN